MPPVCGNVFNIQRYSVKDGPGIRTTVFIKGCPLRCWWCHNPESQSRAVEMAINPAVCIHCGGCWAVCPHNESPGEVTEPLADWQHCTQCGECVEECPVGGRTMMGRVMTVPEVMAEVLKDRLFYDDSGGGVTLSGGEPMVQPEFVRAVLEACGEKDIRTAIDTCGYCQQEELLAVAPLADLFLYDLKAMDDATHRQQTGVSNTRILDNLVALGRVHANIWLRVPVVPGVNDTREELDAMARFASTVKGIRQVDLLTYHQLGSHKNERIGKQASPRPAAPPTAETMAMAADLFRRHGLSEVNVA